MSSPKVVLRRRARPPTKDGGPDAPDLREENKGMHTGVPGRCKMRRLAVSVKRCARRTQRSRRIGRVSTRNRAECVLVKERRRIEAYIDDIARYGRSRARSASISKRKRRRSRGSERKREEVFPKRESRHTPSQVNFLAKEHELEARDLNTCKRQCRGTRYMKTEITDIRI